MVLLKKKCVRWAGTLQLMDQKMRRVQQLAAHLTTAAAAETEADGAPVPLTDEEVRAAQQRHRRSRILSSACRIVAPLCSFR